MMRPKQQYDDTMEAKAAASSFEVNVNKPSAAPATEKHAADDVTMAAAAAAEADAAGGGEEEGLRLSQAYIDYVLSWKPEVHEDPDELYAGMMVSCPGVFSMDEVERRTDIQRELVEQSRECAAAVAPFHAWVRAEFEAKGYVEVDDDYVARGILLRRAVEEDPDYALAFGPMEGVVAEDEDEDDEGAPSG